VLSAPACHDAGRISGDAQSTLDTESRTLTVAVVSSHSVFADTDANIRHFESLIKQASSRGARLVCFPELSLTSYSTSKEVLRAAEEIPGPSTARLERIARAENTYLSVGMAEKDGNTHHITQVLVGPDGYMGKYRKHHPTGSEQACGFSPGTEFPVWDIEGFRLGINICADGRQEDTIQAMKDAGVDVIHHPHGNVLGLGRDAEEWTRGKMVYFVPRATFARAYILINNSAGDTPMPGGVNQYGSGALVIDPLGQVVDRTRHNDRDEKMIVVTLRKPLSNLIPPFEMARLQREP
jgi:predicted amidohydrolase